MIAKLKGIVDTIATDHVVMDVNGVGYFVHCSSRTLSNLPEVGKPAVLIIETVVREDQISLYGFLTPQEKSWYQMLTSVQGVGSKVGLSILSILPVDEIANVIASGDKTSLTRADGVGPKLAARIITELESKVGSIVFAGQPAKKLSGSAPVHAESDVVDVISALVNLGYARVEAFRIVNQVSARLGKDVSFDKLLKESLMELSS